MGHSQDCRFHSSDLPQRGKPSRASASSFGAEQNLVGELGAGAGASQQETAAAHIAAADEIRREQQSAAEDGGEESNVLVGGDAPEEHDVGGLPSVRQGAEIP